MKSNKNMKRHGFLSEFSVLKLLKNSNKLQMSAQMQVHKRRGYFTFYQYICKQQLKHI